jgi:hypothetical protein
MFVGLRYKLIFQLAELIGIFKLLSSLKILGTEKFFGMIKSLFSTRWNMYYSYSVTAMPYTHINILICNE